MLDPQTVANLIDGRLPWPKLREIITGPKDPERFQTVLDVLQQRVAFRERILMPIGEHLYIVQKGPDRIVKCDCGHEFGDYHQNWKTRAAVFVRDTDELLDELYPRLMHSHPEWMEIREFFCPSCWTLLEVEAVPPGYPVVFDFLPDLEGLYQWLGRPLPTQG